MTSGGKDDPNINAHNKTVTKPGYDFVLKKFISKTRDIYVS